MLPRLILVLLLLVPLPAHACGPDSRCAVEGGYYLASEPPGWDGESRLPVVYLHGWNSAPEGTFRNRAMVDSVNRRGALFVAPWAERGYWRQIGACRAEPGRDELADVARHAPYMTIVELHSDDEWRVCLNGTAHCDHANLDRTWRNALETCTPEDRARRLRLAGAMFATPCGLRADLREVFDDGFVATLRTVSLPLIGDDGRQMIVTYGPIAEEIEDPFRARPTLRRIDVAAHSYLDLGFGLPDDQ